MKKKITATVLTLTMALAITTTTFAAGGKKTPKLTTSIKKTMTVGKKQSIKPKLKYKKTAVKAKFSYKSSNKSIATVSKKGVITAKKAGKVKITVTAKPKSSKKYKTIKKTFTINVKKSSSKNNSNKSDSSNTHTHSWTPVYENVTTTTTEPDITGEGKQAIKWNYGEHTGKYWAVYDCGYAVRTYLTDDDGNIKTDDNFTHMYQDAYFDPYAENKLITINPIEITSSEDWVTKMTLYSIHDPLVENRKNHYHNSEGGFKEYTNTYITSANEMTSQEIIDRYGSSNTLSTYYYTSPRYAWVAYTNLNNGHESKGIMMLCNENAMEKLTKTVTKTEQVLDHYKCRCGATKNA